MATLTLKNVPDELMERLKGEAKQSRRSLNQETLARLELSLAKQRRSGEEMVATLRKLHKRMRGQPPLTDEILERAKNEGRP